MVWLHFAAGFVMPAAQDCRHIDGRGGHVQMAGPPSRGSSKPALPQFDPAMFEAYANPASFEHTSLTITEYPNPILRAPNADVTEFDEKLASLCREFFSVMYGANGVGLAAPQVGLNLRLFVYNTDPTAPAPIRQLGEHVVINPTILEYSASTDTDIEGCLSSRSECCIGDICRATSLRVRYLDERGRVKQKRLRGFEARVFQHEYDHVEGVLHIDRQRPEDREKAQPYLDKLVEQHGPGGALVLSLAARARLQPPLALAQPVSQANARRGAVKITKKRKSADGQGAGGGGGGFGSGFGGAAATPKKKKPR